MNVVVGAPPSGLDIFTRFGGVLTDASAITFNINSPASGILTPSGVAGFRRSVGHYDARNFGNMPSGHAVNGWSITWTVTSPAGVTNTATEDFVVATSMETAFTNIDDITGQVKLDLAVSDDKFTSAELETFLEKALNRLNRRLNFTGTTSELSISQTTGAVIPTPNSSIQDLIVLQMECLMAQQRYSDSLGGSIRVKDGDSEIDKTAGLTANKDIVKRICEELDAAILDYLSNDVTEGAGVHGALVTYDNSKVITDSDHDGEGTGRQRDWTSPFDGFGYNTYR
ncbi:hypothetical protein KAR91_50070 [Candidatus Pacearchaeota archaeon]|nr:hypothetical protein [Candidatus Pacearchaeota archaeon]